MSMFGHVGFGPYIPPSGQTVSFPTSAPMAVLPTNPGPLPMQPNGQLAVPHFTGDRLIIPPGQGLSLPAKSAAGSDPPAGKNGSGPTFLQRGLPGIAMRGGPEQKSRGLGEGLSGEQFEKLKEEVKKEVEEQQARREAKLESRWFELPSNTYGTAIWSVLVLEMEALNPLFLFYAADSESVPSDQRWDPEFNWLTNWGKLRLSPFLVAVFFQVSCIGLCLVSWLVQFGFIYSLDERIGGQTFFDLENAQYVCSTSGWVQLISVGFFLAFMLGQIPKVFKNFVIITTGSKETDEARGEEGARTLCITQDQLAAAKHQHKQRDVHHMTAQTLIDEAKGIPGILLAALPAMKYIPRTQGNLRMRQSIAFLFPLAELAVIGYLIYVGVKYIFWSGFDSNEPGDPAHFPNFPDEDKYQFPWMSETQGVEEIIMATLALQFIMDIDEGVFEFVLPKSVQNSVSGTKLSCFGWLPAYFRVSDYVMIGKSLAEDKPEPDTEQYPLGYERYKVLVELQKLNPGQMTDPVFLKFFKDAAASTIGDTWDELEDWVSMRDDPDEWESFFRRDAEMYHSNLVDEVKWLLGFYDDFPPSDPEDMFDHELCKYIYQKLSWVPPEKRKHYWEDTYENIQEEFYEALQARPLRLKWLNLLPDATFIFTLFVIVLPIVLVLLVRAKMGCFNFGRVDYENIPANLVGYWDGVSRLTPVFVVFAVLVAWRGFYLLKGIWQTSQAEQDTIAEMKNARAARKKMKEERDKKKEQQRMEKQKEKTQTGMEPSVNQPYNVWNQHLSQIDEGTEDTESRY